MRYKLYVFLGILFVFIVSISGMWISAYNGEVSKHNSLVTYRGEVHIALGARYEKMGTFIDAITNANETVSNYLEIIRDGRTAFANAIANNQLDLADNSLNEIDNTFVLLLSYMEDNPESYNTVNLYSGFISEFAAATNVVINRMTSYNKAVESYNNHIKTFPNFLFIYGKTLISTYPVNNYNATLPTFN